VSNRAIKTLLKTAVNSFFAIAHYSTVLLFRSLFNGTFTKGELLGTKTLESRMEIGFRGLMGNNRTTEF